MFDHLMQSAVASHRAGRLAEAERLYREVLAQAPNHFDALRLLGTLALQVGSPETAVELFGRAAAVNPSDARSAIELGNALHAAGKFANAAVAYQRATALAPRSSQAHFCLGVALQAAGQTDEAVAAYRRALKISPDDVAASVNLGSALQASHRNVEAAAAYRSVLERHPENVLARNNLAIVLQAQGQFDEAIAACREALQYDPRFVGAHINLGRALYLADRVDEAEEALSRALELAPDSTAALGNLADCHKARGRIDEAFACLRRAVAINPADPQMYSNLVFAACYHSDESRGVSEAMEWDRRYGRPLESVPAHKNDRSPERRLRIGYISPDFRRHLVGINLLPILRAHDRANFEIYCYSDAMAEDAVTEEFRKLSDGWRKITGLSHEQTAELIGSDGIDILVDLALHTAGNRLPVFTLKPAPVQVCYLGYCGTTGLKAMDYRLSDWFLDPSDADLACCIEETIRLPHSYWCYEPLGACPEVPTAPMRRIQVTFGCLNNFAKVSSETLELWMDLLDELPESRLLLAAPTGSAREEVRRRFLERGISAERLEFVGKLAWDQYLRTWGQIDIALDPFPFGGGITTCDALWMGVPVVTLSGRTALGRAGCSILSNVGLPELIAKTPEEYVNIAVSLARNRQHLDSLRTEMRARMQGSPLRDTNAFARDLEAAFREMWRRWWGRSR